MNLDVLLMYSVVSFLYITSPGPAVFLAISNGMTHNMKVEAPVLPQFVTLTAVFMLFSFISLCGYGFMSKSAKHWFSNSARMVWFHRITGGLFVGMGLGLLQLRNTHA